MRYCHLCGCGYRETLKRGLYGFLKAYRVEFHLMSSFNPFYFYWRYTYGYFLLQAFVDHCLLSQSPALHDRTTFAVLASSMSNGAADRRKSRHTTALPHLDRAGTKIWRRLYITLKSHTETCKFIHGQFNPVFNLLFAMLQAFPTQKRPSHHEMQWY